MLRPIVGASMVLVTPGIRPSGAEAGDQKRVMTPAAAVAGGADHLVVGRPIVAAADPKSAADSFRQALGELQALAAADTNDVQVQVEVAMAMGRLGSSFLQQGNAKSALAEFEKSLADCRRLARPGVSNADLAWATASDQFQIGKAHEALASDAKQPSSMRAEQWKQAQSSYQQSIPAIRQSLNSTYGDLAQDALQQAQAGLARCAQELGKVAANR